MKQCILLLCGATMFLPSVNTDAVENDVDAMVNARPMHKASVGHDLQMPQLNPNTSHPDTLQTSAGRGEQASHEAQPTGLDLWLMALAGAGLIVLQLRRKQKSLPQRPLIPNNNMPSGADHTQRHTGVVNFASRT